MESIEQHTALRSLTLLGNHLPRQCGIATFTSDLADAIASATPELECGVVAVNDVGRNHAYSERVRFEVDERDVDSYRRAADYLNMSATDVLCLQHEYGIFGGKAGGHVLALLSAVRMPVVTTLHTLLRNPTKEQRHVMDKVTELSSRLVVMSQQGHDILREVHRVPAHKIDLIPHGIAALPSGKASKARLGVEDAAFLLTFGLLSRDKGIEFVLDALPAVVARHPSLRYVILGATHPHVREREGESYRQSLNLQIRRLGLSAHVLFHDRFVSAAALAEFLAAADIYITPYLNMEQSTSGTLAYAVGNGKTVISTPYSHARELLAEGRGVLVPCRDAAAMSAAIDHLLSDPDARRAMGTRASEYGSAMAWPMVARQYVTSFERAHREGARRHRPPLAPWSYHRRSVALPQMNLQHLRAMTDDVALLQHSVFSVPRYEDGYCVDDNARALLLLTLIEDAGTCGRAETDSLCARYLAFVNYAFNRDACGFRNFMGFDRQWSEEVGSEDSHARALWALGALVGRTHDLGRKRLGCDLFHAALPRVSSFVHVRGWAFALLGIHEFLRAFQGEREVEALQRKLAEQLLHRFQSGGDEQWSWCEDRLTYDNARLPQALIVSGASLRRPDMIATGLDALSWLTKIQCSAGGYFAPVGSNGFYPRGGQMAEHDQQPLEACATVSACLDAWRVSGDALWAREVSRAFSWFLGENEVQVPLYDSVSGGCRDGLHSDRANENQGAESTLSFLLALNDMNALESEMRVRGDCPPGPSTGESARGLL